MTTEPMAPPATMVDDRPADGLFRVNRAALVDEGVFARERAAIFDRC